MAVVGGMLTSAVLKTVGEQVGSAISGQIKLQWDFKDDLMDMKMTLESVEAFLKDAERRSITEKSVQLWLSRLKNAMYDISDMIDGFEANTTPNKSKVFSNLGAKIKMAKEMKRMRVELKKITKQHKDFSFASENTANIQEEVSSVRKTSPKVEETAIVGRIQEKRKILACLSERILTQDFIILAIYGMGGIGKTTLAQLVFNDKQFKEYSPAWVYVSQVFDLDKIERSIISQLSKRAPNMTDLEMAPPNMNIIIVLDDLWENDGFQLDNLKLKLQVGKGAKVIIIVTTRDESIAMRFSTIEPHFLKPLTDEMCWRIIKQKTAFEDRNDRDWLEHIGKEIAKKCGGVALAAQSLGYMLHSRRADEWESVRNSNIWNESSSDDTSSPHHVLSSLKLSYVRMRPCLKMCFGYCAIFPKGQNIVKDDLIHQWISLGFIEPSRVFTPRQLAETYVAKLLGMSFLQWCPESSSIAGWHHDDVTPFTMHDLVHDLARLVMLDEILVTSEQVSTAGISYRYALLGNCTQPLETSSDYLAKIRALRFMNCRTIDLNDVPFSPAKSLRVLDLSECSIEKLPDFIGQFKQLRYLNAPGVQHQTIPNSITNLINLMYLSLRGSSEILLLPESVGEMKGLMYLDLSDCSGIQQLPESFGNLEELVHLNFSNCSCIQSLSQCLRSLTELQYLNLSCNSDLYLPADVEHIGNLTKLEYLNLSCRSNLYLPLPNLDFLGTLTKLKYLNLSSQQSNPKWLPEDLGNLMELKYLNLSGCHMIEQLPASFGRLKSLVYLDLSCCSLLLGIPQALRGLTNLEYLNLSMPNEQEYCGDRLHLAGLPEVIGSLTKLRELNLARCMDYIFGKQSIDQTDSFIDRISTLSNLEHLDLSENSVLRSLPESIGSLRKLVTLNLSDSLILIRLPLCLIKMESLKVLNVEGCSLNEAKLPQSNFLFTLPHFVVHAGDGESSSNLPLLEHANPGRFLELSNLENVKSIQEAQSIKLTEKDNINYLNLAWTRGADRFVEDMNVLEELVPPSTLEEFMTEGYSSVRLPAWVISIGQYLPNLVKITLWDWPKCNSLPPLGQLPNLEKIILGCMHGLRRIDGGIYGGPNAFPCLTEFHLLGMGCLEELDFGGFQGEQMFPKLQYFEISDCPKLTLKSCPPRAVKWDITRSDNVLSSSWVERRHSAVSSSSGVTLLKVMFCKLPLHYWGLLCNLPAPIDLHIQECTDLTCTSPEIIQALNSLKSLTLSNNDLELTCLQDLSFGFKQLEDLEGNMGQLTSLQSSPHLSVCGIITSLPEWLGQLISFNKLRIKYRGELNDLQGNMRQLTSLQSLVLYRCNSMTSLPQWLGELTTLKMLVIKDCARLNDLHETLCNLTSLQSLKLESCQEIPSLPERIGELKSLKKLEIINCICISSLPESIQQLRNLEELRIVECAGLWRWYESDENEKKLAHIKEKLLSID